MNNPLEAFRATHRTDRSAGSGGKLWVLIKTVLVFALLVTLAGIVLSVWPPARRNGAVTPPAAVPEALVMKKLPEERNGGGRVGLQEAIVPLPGDAGRPSSNPDPTPTLASPASKPAPIEAAPAEPAAPRPELPAPAQAETDPEDEAPGKEPDPAAVIDFLFNKRGQ